MKIYLAARFSRRAQMRELAVQLLNRGHDIASRWIWSDIKGHDTVRGGPERLQAQGFALDDVHDIKEADLLISFTDGPGTPGRGGRHVELGMAMALGIAAWIVGPYEHIYHFSPGVERFASLDAMLHKLDAFWLAERTLSTEPTPIIWR